MRPSCKTGTRLYEIWRGMKRRCECPDSKDYPDYGGRGIRICEEWSNSITAFIDWAYDNGYTFDRSLDRINVNDGYNPKNCRWASYIEQQLNTQKESKTYINIRLRADRMRVLLATIPDDAITTLIVRRDVLTEKMASYFSDVDHQDRDPPIPKSERIDKARNKGQNQNKRKYAPKFIDGIDFNTSLEANETFYQEKENG